MPPSIFTVFSEAYERASEDAMREFTRFWNYFEASTRTPARINPRRTTTRAVTKATISDETDALVPATISVHAETTTSTSRPRKRRRYESTHENPCHGRIHHDQSTCRTCVLFEREDEAYVKQIKHDILEEYSMFDNDESRSRDLWRRLSCELTYWPPGLEDNLYLPFLFHFAVSVLLENTTFSVDLSRSLECFPGIHQVIDLEYASNMEMNIYRYEIVGIEDYQNEHREVLRRGLLLGCAFFSCFLDQQQEFFADLRPRPDFFATLMNTE